MNYQQVLAMLDALENQVCQRATALNGIADLSRKDDDVNAYDLFNVLADSVGEILVYIEMCKKEIKKQIREDSEAPATKHKASESGISSLDSDEEKSDVLKD